MTTAKWAYFAFVFLMPNMLIAFGINTSVVANNGNTSLHKIEDKNKVSAPSCTNTIKGIYSHLLSQSSVIGLDVMG